MQAHRKATRAIIFLFLLLPGASRSGQSKGPRVTPLGTQLPKPPVEVRKKEPPEVLEDISSVVGKAVEAHGGRQALDSVQDSISTGKITLFAVQGPKSSLDLTLVRKGGSQVQRILKKPNGELRQGSDGRTSWESFNGMTTPVQGGLVGGFIESQTVRTISDLLDSRSRGSMVREGGMKDETRVLEVETPTDKDSGKPTRKTRYSVDKKTSRVTRLEWSTGETKTLFGTVVPTTEAYAFSDFRTVQGVATPFRIERYVNGIRTEETLLMSVRYNTSVKDDVFKP